ncbi:MAG: Cache 3/Cache 2 fusion domain-containing protein [Rhizobacter sp.]|nr:Cache 3/Cache 2 fusion domain-containing protein [Rhizobacter sp.]
MRPVLNPFHWSVTVKTYPHAIAAAALFAACLSAHAYEPKATIADLDARLAKIGAPKIEGTDAVGGKAVPAIYFGERKINNNYDVVDAVRKAHNATATVFVKDGDEFVRVSTNVLTPEGKRGVGTQLARNAAYAAVSKGEQFCGPIDVLGTAFDACYNPIKDASGKIIGVSYIGHKK